MAFRMDGLDPKGMAVFVADRDRRGFDRNQWESARANAFWFLRDIGSATPDDIASRNRFLARTEPDVPPPLPVDLVAVFLPIFLEAGGDADSCGLAEAIRWNLHADACAELAACRSRGTGHEALAETYLALAPVRRRELCEAVAGMAAALHARPFR